MNRRDDGSLDIKSPSESLNSELLSVFLTAEVPRQRFENLVSDHVVARVQLTLPSGVRREIADTPVSFILHRPVSDPSVSGSWSTHENADGTILLRGPGGRSIPPPRIITWAPGGSDVDPSLLSSIADPATFWVDLVMPEGLANVLGDTPPRIVLADPTVLGDA